MGKTVRFGGVSWAAMNVDNDIKSHQPDWFTGPSLQQVKGWGERIYRSHVCD
jgi:hypothetical protein